MGPAAAQAEISALSIAPCSRDVSCYEVAKVQGLWRSSGAGCLPRPTRCARGPRDKNFPERGSTSDDPAGQALARAAEVDVGDPPVVVTPMAILRRAAAGDVADHLGLAFSADQNHDFDVVAKWQGRRCVRRCW